jgi:cytochrome b
MTSRKILVWDVPTRLFHWLLVGAFVTADSERHRDLHVLFGVTLAGLIGFRLLWGLVGTRYARFTSFAFGPRAVLRSLGSLATLKPLRSVGHTPPASWAIWLMLALGLAVAVTGCASLRGGWGEALEEAHGALAWTLLAVVGVHVAGVVLGSVLHRENLVGAMVTGRKRGEPGEAIARSRWVVGAMLAALVLAFWLDVIAVPGLRGGDGAAGVVHAGKESGRHDKDD